MLSMYSYNAFSCITFWSAQDFAVLQHGKYSIAKKFGNTIISTSSSSHSKRAHVQMSLWPAKEDTQMADFLPVSTA